MALRELSSLEKYLGLKKPNKYSTQADKKIPVLQNNNGPPLVGLVTIACHLVKEAKRPNLLGDSAESRAVVHQWLEYRVTKLDGCTKEDIKTILKDLNLYLQDKVYMAGNQFTLADPFMYYGIHPLIVCHLHREIPGTQTCQTVVDLAIQDKEQYVNVTRWFDHIQHYPGIRHHLPPVVVPRNRLYTSKHH
ncbi:eukaryotic translation elongation factor 1 epsilon-1 isoform X1 [Perca flavescens]|uniref:eukaryotic translation elongation factor 1 epsilon-1 isoform X1 n=1 Tax=Perca flavescens TaxID=8167 RepID=UPI00106EFCD2|nr:eukaryotic translation elongation factor 1 epsilon-1 isoform X1 [Perca flavescens]